MDIPREIWREILLYLPTRYAWRVCRMFYSIEKEIAVIRRRYLSIIMEIVSKGHDEAFVATMERHLSLLSNNTERLRYLQSYTSICIQYDRYDMISYLMDKSEILRKGSSDIILVPIVRYGSRDMIIFATDKGYKRNYTPRNDSKSICRYLSYLCGKYGICCM
jgi:hypothetical protein